jgi:hypothetical protein
MNDNAPARRHNLSGLVALALALAWLTGLPAFAASPTTSHTPLGADGNQPPTVVFQYPTNGTVFSAPYTGNVLVSAAAAGQVVRLDGYVQGVLAESTSNSILIFTVSNLVAGTYDLSAIATDDQGTTATTTISITVLNDAPPTIRLINPTNDTVFSTGSTITVQVDAADSDGTIKRVNYYRQRFCGPISVFPSNCPPLLLASVTQRPFSLSLTNPEPGFYHVFAVATDNVGITTSSDPIRMIVAAPLQFTLPTQNPDGSIQFNVHFEPPVSALTIYSSTNLTNWTLLPSGVPPVGNDWTVIDPDALKFDHRFYWIEPSFIEIIPLFRE